MAALLFSVWAVMDQNKLIQEIRLQNKRRVDREGEEALPDQAEKPKR